MRLRKGSPFGRDERVERLLVGVQLASQGRALADQLDPCLAMDSPLVTFGLAKQSFQVQIVSRRFIDRAQKQPRQKAGHQPHHVLTSNSAKVGCPPAHHCPHGKELVAILVAECRAQKIDPLP